MKKVLIVLLAILLVLALAAGIGYGYAWYRNNHVFIEKDVYPIDAQELDLRDKEISIDYYVELQSQLPNCHIMWMVPIQGQKVDSETTYLKVSSVEEQDTALIATYLKKLKTLDAMDCQDYPKLTALRESMPQWEVLYEVDLGGKAFPPETTELQLEVGEYNYDTLMENLKYLPEVKSMKLRMPELSLEQMDALKEAYPNVDILCTVEILGKEEDMTTTELNLSSLKSEDVSAVAEKLSLLPNLETVELMDASGASALTKEDVKALIAAAPNVKFHYEFDFFGQTLSTDTEEVSIKNVNIGDENEAEVRSALDLMPNCKRMVLDNCKLSNEVLAKIRDDYRDRTKVVWRIYFGDGTSLTDAEIIRTTYNLDNDNCHDLIYCEDTVYMDLGHNEWLKGVPFVAGMPKLEVIIISGSLVEDLTPFENCKNLRVLEAAFCEQIKDVSPLAACTKLEMLNISNTHVTDLSPLDDLPLTHLCAKLNPSGRSRVPAEEQERFKEKHPDCWATFNEDAQPYGRGWRYDEDSLTKLPWYEEAGRQFGYPNPFNNVGWYLKPQEEETK